MDWNQVDIRTSATDFSAETLAQEIVADSRSAGEMIIAHLDDEDPRRARMLLSGLGEHALAALSQSAPARTPQNEGWIIATLTDEMRAFRAKIAQLIEPMLTLKESSNLTIGVRVCDEAYEMAHRLTNSTSKRQELPAVQIKEISEEQRDELIRELRRSRAWRRILEGF